MTMARLITISIIVGVYASCCGQNAAADTAKSLPNERGVIMTTNIDYYGYGKTPSILRHLPVYPGYENTSVHIPQLTLHRQMSRLQSVDVDYATKSIYMYDYYLGMIVMVSGYNKDLLRSNMTFAYLHAGVSRGTVQVAVDWLSHTVYWTDTTFNWIIAAPGQMEKAKMDYYKVIVDENLDSPNGIALDPNNTYLFWIDNGKYPKIERSDMMGGNRHTIITSKGGILKSPMAIEVDIFEKRIYWLDTRTDTVLTAKYDGSDVNVIQRLVYTILTDLAVFRDNVIVVDRVSNSMYTLNKTLGPRKGVEESPAIQFYQYEIDGIAIYSPETQPQRDTDVCAMKKCDQMCMTTKKGADCVCAEGYATNSTSGICTETYSKVIVYANITHICLLDIRAFTNQTFPPDCIFTVETTRRIGSTTTRTASHGETITAFDMDMKKRVLYFVNAYNIIYERDMDLPITNDVKISIVRASGKVGGLAYDALDTNNLYWCESDSGAIMVVDVATRSPRLIATTNTTFTNPTNLIVLLRHRKLAWIAGTNHTYVLAMTMDGRDTRAVYKHTTPVSSLLADEHMQLFYFLSEGKLYSVMFNGTGVNKLLTIDDTAYKLLFYKGYKAWIYTTGIYHNMMKSAYNMYDGNLDNVSTIVDIKVLDTNLQSTNISSPCAYENGNCSQICISEYKGGVMTKVCECKLGFTLDTDLSSCKSELVKDNFIIVTDLTNDALLQIDLETNSISAVPNIDNIIGVYFNAVSKRLIWAEYRSTQILSSYLNGSDRQLVAELGNVRPHRLDMDMTTGNLYYTTYYSSFIGMVTPSGIQVKMQLNTHAWSFLGDIVVHPGKGWLFYTQYNWMNSSIIHCNMDGTNAATIIEAGRVYYPDSLAIDFKHDTLYWSDAQYDTIQRCDFDGLKCATVVNITTAQGIRDLVIDGEYLYYSALKLHHIVRVQLQEPYNSTIVGQHPGIGKLDTMALYRSSNKNSQPVAADCKDRNGLGDCSTICIPTPTGRKCACEEGVCLMSDQRTCSNVPLCDPIITQPSVSSEEEDIFIDTSCSRRLNDTCKYKCTGRSVPTKKQLTCTPFGWDMEFETLCKESICEDRTLQNGHVQSTCGREIGEACLYQCDNNYTSTTDKTVCTKDLSWHPRTACIKSTCDDSTLSNGHVVQANCGKKIGEACLYQCDKDYTNITYKTVCMKDHSWLPWNACTKSICDDGALLNGKVQWRCGKTVGDACMYECDQDYTNTTYNAICMKDLTWHPLNACTKHTLQHRQTDGEWPVNGFIIGLVLLITVLIALVVGLAIFLRRNTSTSMPSKYGIAFYRKTHPSAAIEIPEPPVNDTKDEQPDKMPLANAGAAAADDGFMHSMYREAQREEENWEDTHDKVILTNDSWFKEIQKNTNKKKYNKF